MLRTAVVFILFLSMAGGAAASAISPDWRIIARSHVILSAKPRLSEKAFEKRAAEANGAYVAVPMQVKRWIKGAGSTTRLIVYIQSTDKKELAFVREAYYGKRKPLYTSLTYTDKKYHLLHFWKDATLDKRPLALSQLEQEAVRQQDILQNWRPDRSLPHYEKVGEIIGRMTNPEFEKEAFADLLALGEAAVPAIIHRMNDRRPLPLPHIELVNRSPQAFEAVRHYGPDAVVDALAAILNHMTGEHFGFIYNGASDLERDHCVAGWRIYDATVRAGKPRLPR